jgi:hypothetical protein
VQDGEWVLMVVEGMPDRKLSRVDPERRFRSDDEAKNERFGLPPRPGPPTPSSASPTWRSTGVVAEVIYPTFGLFIDMVPAPDLAMACARAHNDYLAESFLDRPDVSSPGSRAGARRGLGGAELEPPPIAASALRSSDHAARGTATTTPLRPLWRVPPTRHPACCTPTGAIPDQEKGPRWRGHQLREGRPPVGRGAVLLRRAGRARAVLTCGGVRGDRRRWPVLCCERMDEASRSTSSGFGPGSPPGRANTCGTSAS